MHESLQIIVLNTIKHKESGFIIQAYSNNNGRENFFLKSPAKNNKSKPLAHFHPLAILDITLSTFKLSQIPTIKEFSAAYRLASIRESVIKSSIALFMSDLIYKTFTEQENNHELYGFLKESIIELERLDNGISNYHLFFLYQVCKKLGYSPLVKKEAEPGMLFDIPSAGFLDFGVKGYHTFGEIESKILLFLEGCSIDTLPLLKISGNDRYIFIKMMLTFLTYHIGCEIRVNSLEILKEVFE